MISLKIFGIKSHFHYAQEPELLSNKDECKQWHIEHKLTHLCNQHHLKFTSHTVWVLGLANSLYSKRFMGLSAASSGWKPVIVVLPDLIALWMSHVSTLIHLCHRKEKTLLPHGRVRWDLRDTWSKLTSHLHISPVPQLLSTTMSHIPGSSVRDHMKWVGSLHVSHFRACMLFSSIGLLEFGFSL